MNETQRTILWAIVMAVMAVVIAYAAYLARHVLLVIYISGLLAVGLSPVVRVIQRQPRIPRWLAILLLYLVILGVLALILTLILPPLIDQAKGLWVAAPKMFDAVQEYLIQKGILKQHISLREAVEQAPGSGGDAVGAVAGAAIGIAGGVFALVTILILTFYILLDAERLRDAFIQLFPRSRRAQMASAASEVTLKVSAWLNGQLVLAGTIGTTAAFGLWILGIPYFYVLALIAGVGEMIPMVGPVLSAIPAVGVALTISYKKALFVAIFFLIQQQFENHILVPRVMSRQVGVSPVTVIVALLIGGKLLGILGALLAVPTAAILQIAFQQTLGRDRD